MAEKQEYSIGFMFNEKMTQVLLILKNHGPKCVVGRWNGIGGHMEPEKWHVKDCNCGYRPAETPIQCQVREFEEETGVKTTEDDWAKLTEVRGGDFILHCFWGRNNRAVLNARTVTDEQVEIVNLIGDFKDPKRGYAQITGADIPLAPNLSWMLPFLMDKSTKNHLCVVLANYCKDDNLDSGSTAAI